MSGELMRRVERTVVGRTQAEVELQLQLLAERQRLDTRQEPQWRYLEDGRPAAVVVVYVQQPPTPAPVATPVPLQAAPAGGVRVSRLAAALIVTAALTVLGVAAYVVVTLVNALAAVLPLIIGGLFLLGLAALALAGGGRSGTWKTN